MKFCLIFLLNLIELAFCSSKLNYVTCGSVIKLINGNFHTRLHSHDIKYGSGSGQQSVTGNDEEVDVNSFWQVKGTVEKPCLRGEPIRCGDTVRLQHSTTEKNLHSHLFNSPLSGKQEISAFGDKGEGDTGDNWIVTCSDDYWERDSNIRFKHVDTEVWLSSSGRSYGRPISGQAEIVGVSYPDSASYWHTADGIFVRPIETESRSSFGFHDEL